MKLTPGNFLTHIKNLVTGGGRTSSGTVHNDAGYLHDVNYGLTALTSDPTSVAVTDSTGGTPGSTFAAITAPAANATTSLSADMLAVKNAISSIATFLNSINAFQSRNVAVGTNLRAFNSLASTTTVGYVTFVVPRDYDEATDTFALKILAEMAGATDTPLLTVTPYRVRAGGTSTTLPAVATTVALGSTPKLLEFDLSKNGLKRDDVVTLKITSAAHTTDAIQVFSTEPVYRSTLVSYFDTDSSTGKPETGNSLR